MTADEIYAEARDAADLRYAETVETAYRNLRGTARQDVIAAAKAQQAEDYRAAWDLACHR